jgi:hypothetical protein
MSTATDEAMTIVDAITPRGEKLTLVTDPAGDYVTSIQRAFLGGVELIYAHKIGPSDVGFLKADTTRFSVVSG